jgi:hypothetical protein
MLPSLPVWRWFCQRNLSWWPHKSSRLTPQESHLAEFLILRYQNSMIMTLDIPETLAAPLKRAEAALPRVLLEGFAVEAYRQGILSAAQVRVLMGHESRWETEDFLSAHDAWPGTTVQQVTEDGRQLSSLLSA